MEQKAMDAVEAFHNKAQNVYIWAKILDLVLSFLRNGLAYAYLIGMVLAERAASLPLTGGKPA